MTINLNHAVEDHEFFIGMEDLSDAQILEMLDEVGEFTPEMIEDGEVFFVGRATSDDGDVYENVAFVVDAVFTIDLETFIQGAGFRFNYTEYMRDIRTAFKEARPVA